MGEKNIKQAILRRIRAIPRGSVMAYGDVAAAAGFPGRARLVARILSESGGDLPWHRVLRADGSLARHLYAEQRQRLLAEGVRFRGDRVELAAFRWDGH